MLEHKNWKQKLCKVLRNYRATSHTTTEKFPSEVIFPNFNININIITIIYYNNILQLYYTLVIICYNKVIKLLLESDKTILYLTIVQILI